MRGRKDSGAEIVGCGTSSSKKQIMHFSHMDGIFMNCTIKIEYLKFRLVIRQLNGSFFYCNQDLRFVVVTRILFRELLGRQDCNW